MPAGDRYIIRDVSLGYEIVDRHTGFPVATRMSRSSAIEYANRRNHQERERIGADAIAIEQAEMDAALSRPDRFEQE